MENGIWACYTVEIVLALGLIVWFLKKKKLPSCLPSWLKNNARKEPPPPVCKSEVCARLNECMVHYMKKRLDYEDDTEELEMVKRQLLDQIKVHNELPAAGRPNKEKQRRSLMQCLRTSLVAHPDDVRGR